MGILELLIDVLKFAGVLVAFVVALPLVAWLVGGLIRLVRRAIFAWIGRAPQPVAGPPEWPPDGLALTLLVRVDEGEGVFHPAVQVRGGARRRGRIRLQLVDRDGAVRLTLKRAFPAAALNTELRLPSFAPPVGATVDEVLGWHWDVILSGERSELRWREHPGAAGGLNPEAELQGGGAAASVKPVRRRCS